MKRYLSTLRAQKEEHGQMIFKKPSSVGDRAKTVWDSFLIQGLSWVYTT